MSSTYKQSLYQIVFSTKYREHTLDKSHRADLFKCMAGILKKKNCHVYEVNGISDHLHIITSLHGSICVADLVKTIKLGSTSFIKEKKIFPNFNGWQDGYASFTYSIEARENLIQYAKNQEAHHYNITSREELIMLLEEHQIAYDIRYLE